MAEDKYDGCGDSNIWATSDKDPFYNACQWHDKAYSEGSFAQEHLGEKKTDKIFLHQMLLIAGKNTLLKARAYLYESIVKIIGLFYWEGKQ